MCKTFMACLLVVGVVFVTAMAAEKEYRHPTVVLPYAHSKPTIDGTVNDAEWQGALSHEALQSVGRKITVPVERHSYRLLIIER